VAVSLVAQASARQALICMTSHGRSRVGKLVLGSVTTEVVRQCAEPVVVVGPEYRPAPTIAGRRLVVCLDGSELSEQVLPVAETWAHALRMPLWLIESVAPDAESALARASGGDLMESSYVGRMAHGLPGEVDWDVLHAEHPAEAIVSITKDWPVGLLAMATHGRSGWSRVRFGSVAMQVLQTAACPVLLVHPTGDDGEDAAG
jgi:nucleotide-binding universal stress UspA family protein